MEAKDYIELSDLILKLLDNSIDTKELSQLEEMLRHPASQDYYIDYIDTCYSLEKHNSIVRANESLLSEFVLGDLIKQQDSEYNKEDKLAKP